MKTSHFKIILLGTYPSRKVENTVYQYVLFKYVPEYGTSNSVRPIYMLTEHQVLRYELK
jgi:hypothetical protein